MSDSPMDTPPAPPFRGDGTPALQLTLKYGATPIGTRASSGVGDVVPEAPIDVRARRVPGGWEVEGPDGPRLLGDQETVALKQGEVEVEVTAVRQSRFARFRWDEGDVVLPVIMLATSVLVLQVSLLFQLFSTPPDSAGFEPTPEYIARLLDRDYEGKDRGVLAPTAPRPKQGDAIESFYLQPGHDGPRDHLGGGKNLGERVQEGNAKAEEARPSAPVAAAGGGEEPTVTPPPEAGETEAERDANGEADGEEEPIAVHVDEGWGLTDWYDTQDARKDAQEIKRQLEVAREVLRLDPDDPFGLTTRAYYEYLAFDFDAARATYDHFTRLYPEEPAGWNNLALVYKRVGEYEKEEELYRIALGLSPEDDHALMNLALCVAHQGRFDEALALMDKVDVLRPDDPYADLHRAKIYAEMGKEERAYRLLQKSLAAMRKLDTLHNIEFRQDIRVDPAFEEMREQDRFKRLLDRFYGDHPGGWWKKKKAAP